MHDGAVDAQRGDPVVSTSACRRSRRGPADRRRRTSVPSRLKRPTVPGGAGTVLMTSRLGTARISRPPLKFSVTQGQRQRRPVPAEAQRRPRCARGVPTETRRRASQSRRRLPPPLAVNQRPSGLKREPVRARRPHARLQIAQRSPAAHGPEAEGAVGRHGRQRAAVRRQRDPALAAARGSADPADPRAASGCRTARREPSASATAIGAPRTATLSARGRSAPGSDANGRSRRREALQIPCHHRAVASRAVRGPGVPADHDARRRAAAHARRASRSRRRARCPRRSGAHRGPRSGAAVRRR